MTPWGRFWGHSSDRASSAWARLADMPGAILSATPPTKGKRVFSVEGEGQTTLMKSSERRADSAAMGRLRLLQGISGEEGDDGSGLARKRLKDAPRSVVNGCGAHDAALSEMLHEAEKEGE